MNDEAYSDARLNAILSAGFDLDRGGKLHLFEIDGEISDGAFESQIELEAGVTARNARSIAFLMRKWLRIRFQECMNSEEAHTLTRQQFQSCFDSACESTCRNGLMNYATAAFLGKSRVDGELNSRQLYIAQMDWVAVPGQQQYKAAQDYIIATINRQAWAEDDSISDIDVERFEQELLAGYKGNSHIAQMAHDGGTPEEIGLALFDGCLAPSHCKGMFRKSDPVVEVKPIPKKSAGGDDALAYFGLNAPEAPTCAPGGGADNGRIQTLEANVAALRAESAALGAAKAEEERKSADLEQQLAAERQMRASAEAERDRLRSEVLRLKNELEDTLTAPRTQLVEAEPVREVRVAGLLKPPATAETFPGEVREHILAVLSEGLEAAQSSERERRAAVLEDVLSANKPGSELERRRRELKQIIKDTGSFVDARTIAALEKLGFKCVSGNKHWKLDYANVRIPISKTPSDHRAALNTATDIANRCF